MKKIAYITVNAPYGSQETFILTEMLALKELGVDILIIPREISSKLFNKRAEPILENTLNIPLFNFQIIIQYLKYLLTNPISYIKIINDIFFKARNVRIALKNLIIMPKAVYLSIILKEQSISHLHAHWGSTTATMAYIISKVTGIPWSFTAHRWDIPENNLLKEKCKSASFVRAIDENGRKEIIDIIKDEPLTEKISVIHMGVLVGEPNKGYLMPPDIFTFLCPANFVHKKGHRYLFEACKILSEKSLNFRCLIAGDGPLEEELRKFVGDLDLSDYIEFLGRLPHERLLDLYGKGEINAVVLPSITTEDGEKEGIPVALMEAMSYGIPVVSTNTGGIPELIGDGSGIMVEERDPEAIANSIEKLINDTAYYGLMSEQGRRKTEREFNVSVISRELSKLFYSEINI